MPEDFHGQTVRHILAVVDTHHNAHVSNHRVRHDNRNRHDRTQSRNVAWTLLLPALTDAFLAWKHRKSIGASLQPSPPSESTWSIQLVDFFGE